MKKLYGLDKVSLFGIFLIYFLSAMIASVARFKYVVKMPAVVDKFKLPLAVVATLVIFLIIYGVYNLLLKKTEVDFKPTIIVNMSLSLALVQLVNGLIIILTKADLNHWLGMAIFAVGYLLLLGLNWLFLPLERTDKIKISVWTVICLVVSVI